MSSQAISEREWHSPLGLSRSSREFRDALLDLFVGEGLGESALPGLLETLAVKNSDSDTLSKGVFVYINKKGERVEAPLE